jgi:hypothetical protein
MDDIMDDFMNKLRLMDDALTKSTAALVAFKDATEDPWIDPEVAMPNGNEEVILLYSDATFQNDMQVGQGHFGGVGWNLAWYYDHTPSAHKVHGWQKLPTAPK